MNTILIGVVIFLSHYFAVSLRWQFYVNTMNYKISFKSSLKLISLGAAANQVFFGNLAMDAIRIVYLKRKNNMTSALGSVFLDRFTALQSMWVILTIIYIFDNSFSKDIFINNIITLVCLCGITSLLLPLVRYIKLNNFKKIVNFLHNVAKSFSNTFKNFQNFSLVYLSSFFILFSSGFVTWLIASDLDVEITFLQMLMVTLFGILITAIPISVNGWGVREISFVSLLGVLNISIEKSVLISVIFGLMLLISSILGLFFYLTSRRD